MPSKLMSTVFSEQLTSLENRKNDFLRQKDELVKKSDEIQNLIIDGKADISEAESILNRLRILDHTISEIESKIVQKSGELENQLNLENSDKTFSEFIKLGNEQSELDLLFRDILRKIDIYLFRVIGQLVEIILKMNKNQLKARTLLNKLSPNIVNKYDADSDLQFEQIIQELESRGAKLDALRPHPYRSDKFSFRGNYQQPEAEFLKAILTAIEIYETKKNRESFEPDNEPKKNRLSNVILGLEPMNSIKNFTKNLFG